MLGETFRDLTCPCRSYRNRTSPVLPLPPALYAALPRVIKQVLLLELPLYETDWKYEGWASSVGVAGPAPPPGAFSTTHDGAATSSSDPAQKLRESLVASGAYQTA